MTVKRETSGASNAAAPKENLSYADNGRVSVQLSTIVSSERVQTQVKAVKEIAAAVATTKR